jgi:hypothetical protein
MLSSHTHRGIHIWPFISCFFKKWLRVSHNMHAIWPVYLILLHLIILTNFMWHCIELQKSTQSGSAIVPIQLQNSALSPCLVIQTNLACPRSVTKPNFMYLSATIHEFPPQNKKCILTFNRLPLSYFWFVTRVVSPEVVHPLKIYQPRELHGTTLTGASCATTSEVWTSVIWNDWI